MKLFKLLPIFLNLLQDTNAQDKPKHTPKELPSLFPIDADEIVGGDPVETRSHTISPAPTTTTCLTTIVEITTDQYGIETRFDIVDPDGDIIVQQSGFLNSGFYQYEYCLPPKCDYTFTIYDTFGDGICCSYGQGSYSLTYNGEEIRSGGDFLDEESTDFGCVGSSPPVPSPIVDVCADSTFSIAYNLLGTTITCLFVSESAGCLCDQPLVSSHCPVTCASCDEYFCVDSFATFYTPTGVPVSCDLVAIADYCDIDIVRNTCRGTCGVCE